MAPEMLSGTNYDLKIDVWSVGILMYEMITGIKPFFGNNHIELLEKIQEGLYSLPKNTSLSLQGLQFLKVCLQYNHKNRSDIQDLVNHPYISEYIQKLKQYSQQMSLSPEKIFISDDEIRDLP